MRLLTIDDIIDLYAKLNQRGINFIRSKFNINDVKRAKTAFNHENIQSSNWWMIPEIRKRWNFMVTKNENLDFIDFTVNNFLKDEKYLKMLSLGSGNCSSELKFAAYNNFKEIVCTDISEIPLKKAENKAKKRNLNNIKFKVQDTNTLIFTKNYYDIVYFRASLHHFKNIENLVGKLIIETLKPNGFLIIDEYVGPNRIQFPKHQIKAINKAIQLIPKKYRKRYKLNIYKNKVYGPGIIRMKIADPSECIESENILPSIHKYYDTIHEASYGGNILMAGLKDISHHFIDINDEKKRILKKLFDFENDYLQKNESNFVFGIYQPKI